MSAEKSKVRWVRAEEMRKCDECYERIYFGERMAVYTEVCVDSRSWRETKHLRIPRHYCNGCGELLVDSLTTTEDTSCPANG